MIHTMNKEPLNVSTEGTAGPFIRVPVSQLDEISQVLDKNSIHYWVEENVISLNGGPEIAVVNFGRGADVAAVRAALDSVRHP